MPVPNLPFQTGIPAGGNFPADDQPVMQTNSDNTYAAFNVDHIPFRVSGTGLHAQVNLPNGVGNTTPQTPVGNANGCCIYGQSFGAASTGTFTVPTATLKTFNGIPLISGPIIGPANRAANWTTLWPGILMQYGQVTTGIGNGSQNFNVAFPSTVIMIQATPIAGSSAPTASVWVKFNDLTKFDWKLTGGLPAPTGFYWMAIGY